MDIDRLQQAVAQIKEDLERAISTATVNGREYESGHQAKTGLIRSGALINRIHEVVKLSLREELEARSRRHIIHPPIGQSSPELGIAGLLKAKRQDVVLLFDGAEPVPEPIEEGPLAGDIDPVGYTQSNEALVIGIRSQLSSVAKNFDTLMERAFAETLNLRLRLPDLVMGEVYLLPVVEYDDRAMRENRIAWKDTSVPVERFINTFLAISGRAADAGEDARYMYERTAFVLVDLREEPPRLFLDLEDLREEGHISRDYEKNFDLLSPEDFASDIIDIYNSRHSP